MGASGHGVVAGAAPGVAAQYSAQGQQQSAKRAVAAYGLDGILAACRREAAGGREMGRDGVLIEPDGEYQQRGQQSSHRRSEPEASFSSLRARSEMSVCIDRSTFA